jgi:signal peptidase I
MKFFRIKISSWRILTLILFLAGFLTFYLNSSQNFSQNSPQNSPQNPVQNPAVCVSEERPLKVRGNSLSGLIEDGAVLKILMGYYQCHPVERGDLVVYNYSSAEPLIKIAKGIPGDKFHLQKTTAGCWNILINGGIIKNFQETPYCISEQGYQMLSLYERDYKGEIPENAYLILGNQVGGTLDSSRFGLVGKDDILGKIVKP